MKRTIIVLIGILIFFSLINDTDFNNNIKNYIEKDYYKTNTYDYKIISNLDYFKTSKYFKNEITNYTKITNNYLPKNKQELLDIYYTILNNGWENFAFYCDANYKTCLEDIEELAVNSSEFSNINQLIGTYNEFSTITSAYDNGRIDVSVNKKYSTEDEEKINNEIDRLINELDINSIKSVKDKIKAFHDYLVITNKYDTVRESTGESEYHSDTAIGTLFEGYSVCSGYTDALGVFLDKINVENYKIANDKHVWNIINLDGQWFHIDLTWDDPVTNTGEDVLEHDYFMINTSELFSKDNEKHYFDNIVYEFVN